MTLRAEEVGPLRTLIDTKHIELERCGPPLVDTDWHAICQAFFKRCTLTTKSCTRRHGPRSRVTVKRGKGALDTEKRQGDPVFVGRFWIRGMLQTTASV